MKRFTSLFLFSCLVLFIACQTDVELCDRDEHPHKVGVSFNYNWGKTKPAFIPTEMLVIANRIINMKKTPISVNSLTGKGHYVVPNAAGLPSFDPIDTLRTTFDISKGTYKFFTFNMENGELDLYSVRYYVERPEMVKEDILVTYRTYSSKDSRLKFRIPGFTDHNPYSDYMQYATSAVFYDSISRMEINDNKSYKLNFKPKDLTQQVDFYFTITKDSLEKQPFKIDAVYAEISGIPQVFNIATGYLNIQKTSKLMFPTDSIIDNDKNKSVKCHGEIHVPGIVQNHLSDVYTGPGIMQVMIYCSIPDPDGNTNPDGTVIRHKKKFQGKINIYNTLEKTPSIKIAANKKDAKITKTPLVLEIKAEMKIDGQKIIEASDDDGGIDVWKSDTAKVAPMDI